MNLSDRRTSVTIHISNKSFILDPNQSNPFGVEPGEKKLIKLVFIPKSLTEHSCLVTMNSEDQGTSRYRLRGHGTAPRPFDTTRISGNISQVGRGELKF